MIKLGKRKNLFYPIMSIIFTFSRKVENILMDKLIGFDGSLLLTLIMFLAEIVSGLIFFIYEKCCIFKRSAGKAKFMGIKLIQAPDEIKPHDSKFKIYLYILIIAFIDFFEFSVDTLYFPKYNDISSSLYVRLRCTLTLFSGLVSSFLLKFSLYAHQKLSLIIIFILLITTIFVDYIFEGKTKHYFFVLFLIFINYFFDSFFDIIEKYLLEYDFINPFKLVFVEGVFGFFLTCLYTFVEDPFKETKEIYEEKNNNKFILLISFLIIYFFLCAGRNIYRVITNKLYFPITRSLTDSIFDPLLILYYFIFENDFYVKDKDKQSILYFIINLIISIIYVFFGCVYNEVFILFCCGLAHNTHDQISERASIVEKYELNDTAAQVNDEYFVTFK